MKAQKRYRLPMIGRVKKKKPIKLAARATTRDEYDEDYGDTYTAEPSMRFTQALIVVILLHVIAVGGFFAFTKVKASQEKRRQAETAEAAKVAAAAKAEEESKPTPLPAPVLRTHTVERGDTLGSIARKYGTTVPVIERLNDIKADSIISIGQELKLPAPKATSTSTTTPTEASKPAAPPKTDDSIIPEQAAAPAATPAQKTAASTPAATPAVAKSTPVPQAASPATYVVVAGDNPTKIARKLNVSEQELLKLNDIKDPTKLQIGQKLKIPAKR